MKANKETSEHYNWGEHCDGWHLVKTDTLSVIQERMPPGTAEALHLHNKAQQFFYILKGTATFELEHEVIEVPSNEGLHVRAGQKHKIINNGIDDLWFLVVSEPKSHGDRTNIKM